MILQADAEEQEDKNDKNEPLRAQRCATNPPPGAESWRPLQAHS
jgi:hypothetical protein